MDDDHLVELFEERAAIIEYDGKTDRSEAEKMAYFDIKKTTCAQAMPKKVQAVVKLAMEKLMKRRKTWQPKNESSQGHAKNA